LTAAIYGDGQTSTRWYSKGTNRAVGFTLTTDVANYPGFPEGISGPDLVNNMKEQASQFGADLEHGIVVDVDDSDRPFRVEVNDGTVYTCDAFLAASGAASADARRPRRGRSNGLRYLDVCDL